MEAGEHRFPYGTSRYCHFTIKMKESLSSKSAEGAELLGRRDLCQRDVGRGHPLQRWDQII
jgi:hypothetical protein